jgi:hypothetical protein
MLLTKWQGSANESIKKAVISYYTDFYYNITDSYKIDNKSLYNKSLYDIYFSKYRIYIHNNMIERINQNMNERAMFLKLQQYHKYKLIKEEELVDIYDNLRYRYKIHLQPKTDEIIPVVERILYITSIDPLLLNYIQEIKFMTYMALREDITNLPIIVVYIKPLFNHTETEIQNTMKYILNAFVKEFDDSDIIGNGLDPRYNHKINDLIYYAQGHGLLKEMILNSENENMIDLLDAESNYSHFNCSKIGYPYENCHIDFS